MRLKDTRDISKSDAIKLWPLSSKDGLINITIKPFIEHLLRASQGEELDGQS